MPPGQIGRRQFAGVIGAATLAVPAIVRAQAFPSGRVFDLLDNAAGQTAGNGYPPYLSLIHI